MKKFYCDAIPPTQTPKAKRASEACSLYRSGRLVLYRWSATLRLTWRAFLPSMGPRPAKIFHEAFRKRVIPLCTRLQDQHGPLTRKVVSNSFLPRESSCSARRAIALHRTGRLRESQARRARPEVPQSAGRSAPTPGKPYYGALPLANPTGVSDDTLSACATSSPR